MRKYWLVLIALCALTGGAGWWFRKPVSEAWRLATGGLELGLRRTLQPDPTTYAALSADLEEQRAGLAKRHNAAKSEAERRAVEDEARVLLEKTLPVMMRCWLGTPWDFNGTAEKPGGGHIACGYFVATVLRDAGFQVDRCELAQQASGNILRSFLPKDSCVRTIGQDYQKFADALEKGAPGIYLVGLDTHVGFLIVRKGGFRMIHSSGSQPWCVVDQDRENANVLQKSNWRMIGNLTADSGVIRTWLKGGRIVTKGA